MIYDDIDSHFVIVKIIIAYTCTGVFVVTAIITILAILGIIRIDHKYLNKLFVILVVEIVVISVGAFSNLMMFDPKPVQEALTEGQSALQVLRTEETAQTSNTTEEPENLPARVYLHIPSASVRSQAEQAQMILREMGALVPGIENVGTERSPRKTEVRYFRKSAEEEAKQYASALKDNGIEAEAAFIPGYEDANIRPRHFELWFAR